jgi:hypothetical protein
MLQREQGQTILHSPPDEAHPCDPGARTERAPIRLETTFAPIEPRPETLQAGENYARVRPPGFLSRAIDKILMKMHDKR